MKSRFSAAQLEDGLRIVYTSMGTDNPTDAQIKKAYQSLFELLYPPKEAAPLTPRDRQDAILFRRALERAHPFLMQDIDIISQEKRRSPADCIDIVHFTPRPTERPGRGLVILRRGGNDQILPFYGEYPTHPTLPWLNTEPPLHTLLANLLHRRRAVQYDTPVRVFEGSYDRTGRLIYAPKGSAMALWAYLDEPR